MQNILERYTACQGESESPDVLNSTSNEPESDRLTKYTEKLKLQQRNLMGEDLDRLSLKDLVHLEHQIDQSIGRIRARQGQLLIDNLEQLNKKVADATKMLNESSKLLQGSGCSYPHGDSARVQVHPENDGALRLRVNVGSCGQSYQASAPKRSVITEDLNRSPKWME